MPRKKFTRDEIKAITLRWLEAGNKIIFSAHNMWKLHNGQFYLRVAHYAPNTGAFAGWTWEPQSNLTYTTMLENIVDKVTYQRVLTWKMLLDPHGKEYDADCT